jgi:hypothetical protein
MPSYRAPVRPGEVVGEIVAGPSGVCNLSEMNVEAVVADMKKRLEEQARAAGLSVKEYVVNELGKIFGVVDEASQASLSTAQRIIRARANAMLSGKNKLYKVTVTETRLYKVECLVEAADEEEAEALVDENGAVEYEEREELIEISDTSVDDVEEVSSAP